MPFDCAIAKRSVTPASVRNSWLGNPAITVLTGSPPMYTPTIHASATDSTPTLSRLTQLISTASVSAETEISARFMMWGQQIVHEFGRMQRANSREVRNLLPARGAAGHQHVVGSECAGGRKQTALADGAAILRSDLACSRTSPPCRSNRHRDRRLSRRGSGQAGLWRKRDRPSPSDDNDRGRRSAQDPGGTPATRARATSSSSSQSSNSRDRLATTRALRRSSPLSRSGASSRMADRQLGSRNTSGWPASARREEPIGVLARALARLVEQSLRDERPAATDVRRERCGAARSAR